MKKIITLAAAAMMLTGFAPTAAAYDFSAVNDDGVTIYYTVTSATGLTVEVSGGKYSGAVNIPSIVTYLGREFSVTSIGDYAFQNCSGLTSIDIPSTITKIGESAFYECHNLTHKSEAYPRNANAVWRKISPNR